jgi:hypothetical protein
MKYFIQYKDVDDETDTTTMLDTPTLEAIVDASRARLILTYVISIVIYCMLLGPARCSTEFGGVLCGFRPSYSANIERRD